MPLIDWKRPIDTLHGRILDHYGTLDSDQSSREVLELEEKTGDPNFWNDRENAGKILTKIKRLKSSYEPWEKLVKDDNELLEFYALACETHDETLESEIKEIFKNVENQFEQLTTLQVLSDESDPLDCYVTIHSGAGGTEACDWARMLARMYIRYAEEKTFSLEIVDEQPEEGGIKSLTMSLHGPYAYGLLKGETGIHRLVRISPFDSGARRHTSFASVYVTPILDDTITVEIRPEDIRVDTYRASGAGGQKVNKTSSAVRMTHFETGIVVQCQNERSQHRNRDIAMSMLKGRVYNHYKNVRDAERAKSASVKHNIGFGSQIRSYVFHPYTMVKDQRTKMQISSVENVMDGKIQPFIDAYLKLSWEKMSQKKQENLS